MSSKEMSKKDSDLGQPIVAIEDIYEKPKMFDNFFWNYIYNKYVNLEEIKKNKKNNNYEFEKTKKYWGNNLNIELTDDRIPEILVLHLRSKIESKLKELPNLYSNIYDYNINHEQILNLFSEYSNMMWISLNWKKYTELNK